MKYNQKFNVCPRQTTELCAQVGIMFLSVHMDRPLSHGLLHTSGVEKLEGHCVPPQNVVQLKYNHKFNVSPTQTTELCAQVGIMFLSEAHTYTADCRMGYCIFEGWKI